MSFLRKRSSFFRKSPNTLSRSLSIASSHRSDGPTNHTEPIFLSLDGIELVFEEGQWSSEKNPVHRSHSETETLQIQNRKLNEESQLLKYKVDILLDMLAVSNLDALGLEGELENYNKNIIALRESNAGKKSKA
eukprot:Sdes_comp9507_c0_seq1m978